MNAPILAVAWSRRRTAADLLAALAGPLGWNGELEHDGFGKPDAQWFRDRGWAISVSHTEGLAACALSTQGAVGVDVEAIDPSVKAHDVAATRFPPLAANRVATAERDEVLDLFFRYWTLNEAALKALGIGFASPVDLQFTLDPPAIAGEAPKGRSWSAFEIDCGPDHRMAAALLRATDATPVLIAGELD